MAADLPVKAPPAAAAEVFGWSGFYVGGNAGYDWGRAAYNGVLTAPAPFLPIDVAGQPGKTAAARTARDQTGPA